MGLKSKPTNTITTNVFKNTTTSNPYAYSKTDNNGTTSGFYDGTALKSVYNFVNNSVDSLLDEYLNPNLNSVTNQAKLNAFANTLSNQTRYNLENNIINPLSSRNMIRSSQANDLYKNLANQNISSVSNYANELLSSSQGDTAKVLSNLLSYYMQGANYLSDMQDHSLKASSGMADKYTINQEQKNDSEMVQKALAAVISIIANVI